MFTGDPALLAIARPSLVVSLPAVLFGALVGVPFGSGVALTLFPGREPLIVTATVVVGLLIQLCCRARGRSESWGVPFTPQTMITAQAVIAPIIAALTRQMVDELWTEYRDGLWRRWTSVRLWRIAILIWERPLQSVTAPLAHASVLDTKRAPAEPRSSPG